MNYTMVSIDCGKEGAMTLWEDVFAREIIDWSFDNGKTLSQNICDIVYKVERIVRYHRPIIVMERPGRQMHIQWVMYSDIRYVANRFRCGFHFYMPTAIKKRVTGNGRASKSEMKRDVWSSGLIVDVNSREKMLDNEHKVDSMAIGICHIRKER